MSSKFFHGSGILLGNNTVPGVQLSPELKKHIPTILKACRDWGLDFYPTVVQLLNYDEISEVAAYGGFPVRFPHWSFGMEYEELQRGSEARVPRAQGRAARSDSQVLVIPREGYPFEDLSSAGLKPDRFVS